MTPRNAPPGSASLRETGADSRRPILLIDVDGVLNVITSSRQRSRLIYHERYVHRRIDGFHLTLNPANGPLLAQLAADTGAELAWGSTWEQSANREIGPLLGIPELPFAPVAGHRTKADGVVPWTAGRPFVWFEDDQTVIERAEHLAVGQPHLIVRVDEATGLTEAHIEAARVWLNRAGGRASPHATA